MSTLAFAELTNKREVADPGTSTSSQPPGVKTYVDALAGLVPAEVLTLHALILSATTEVIDNTTRIADAPTLRAAFWGLVALSMALYIGPRLLAKTWEKLDWLRLLIPPFAFTGWTMLQRATAFDAAFPTVEETPRTVSALFLGVILGVVAAGLAKKADQNQPGNARVAAPAPLPHGKS